MKQIVEGMARPLALALGLAGFMWAAAAHAQGANPDSAAQAAAGDKPAIRAVTAFITMFKKALGQTPGRYFAGRYRL